MYMVEVEWEGRAGVGRGELGHPQAFVSGQEVRWLRPCPRRPQCGDRAFVGCHRQGSPQEGRGGGVCTGVRSEVRSSGEGVLKRKWRGGPRGRRGILNFRQRSEALDFARPSLHTHTHRHARAHAHSLSRSERRAAGRTGRLSLRLKGSAREIRPGQRPARRAQHAEG